MNRRPIIMANKAKRNSNLAAKQQASPSSSTRKSRSVASHSYVTLRICAERHPVLHGVGSLGNISGGYVRFERYLRGDYVRDMRGDWTLVGKCLKESMAVIR